MITNTRFSDGPDSIELAFVERERTPEAAMRLGIRLHLAGLSLSNTVSILEKVGVDRSRKAIHDWVHKADLEPQAGRAPDEVAVDETVINYNGDQFWLFRGRSCDERISPSQAVSDL